MAPILRSRTKNENLGCLPSGTTNKKIKVGDRSILKDISNANNDVTDTDIPEIQVLDLHVHESDPSEEAQDITWEVEERSNVGLKFYDIEENNEDNIFYVTAYSKDIYAYLKTIEAKYLIECGYLERHHLTPQTRAILVDWIAEVLYSFNLTIETFQRAVNILDRFMHNTASRIVKEDLQLIGAVCIFIACKYEETSILDVRNLVYITDNSVTRSEILTMEIRILYDIDFFLGYPTAITFIRRNTLACKGGPILHACSKYFADLAQLEYTLCDVKPSVLAAACTFLALCFTKEEVNESLWSEALAYNSSCTYSDFKQILPTVARIVIEAPTSSLRFIIERYSQAAQYAVSMMPSLTRESSILRQFVDKRVESNISSL